MVAKWHKFLILLFAVSSYAAPKSDPLASAARHYLSERDYKQALQLWQKVQKKDPSSVTALFHLSELQLLFQGHREVRNLIMDYLERYSNTLKPKVTKRIQEKLGVLQATFVTDEGQSKFLQALSKIREKGCRGAVELLAEADSLEKGNTKVLWTKAECERELKSFKDYHATLKAAFHHNPFDSKVIENFVESHLYHGQSAELLKIYKKHKLQFKTMRQRTGIAVAMVQSGNYKEAAKILEKVLKEGRHQIHPIVLFSMGQILANRVDSIGIAINYIERFISMAGRRENTLIAGWDPYRCQPKITEAKAILEELRKRETPTELSRFSR